MDKITVAPPRCQLHAVCDGYCETTREVEKGFCEACLVVNDQHWCKASGNPLHFGYVNYRGEYSKRRATPISFEFGESEYHTSPQWLMRAVDHDKGEIRQFALNDMVLDGRNLSDDSLKEMFKHWIENEFKPRPAYSTINMRTERCTAFIAGAKAAPYMSLGEESRKLRAMAMTETGYRIELQARLAEITQTMREYFPGENPEAHNALMARCEAALSRVEEGK
jgi:hypothetical protein